MTDTIHTLIHFDQQLFLWLNGMHAPWADVLMYWYTFKYTWIPLYLILIVITVQADRRRSIAILVTVLLAVALADKVTSGLMKPYFMRFRPCHEPALQGLLHQVTDCGGLYGFASSHASTSFAVAMVWFTLLKDKVKRMGLIFVWAIVYSYSRVYVGVHYPLDIVAGAAVGLLSGWLFIQLYLTFLTKYYRN